MKNSVLFAVILCCTWFAGIRLSAQTLHGSFDSKFKRYVINVPFGGQINTTWHVEAWKGERITKQVVLWTSGKIDNLNISATELKGSAGKIPSSAITFRYGKYVKGDMLSKECGEYTVRKGYQQIIDAWSADPVTTVTSSDPLKLWVVVQIPKDTPKGSYTGKVIAKGGSGNVELNIDLFVSEMELADVSQWTFHLDLWQYPVRVVDFYNSHHPTSPIELWSDRHFALLEPFYRELADCGQKAISAHIKDNALGIPSMIKWIKKTDGEWEYDFSAFDRYVHTLTEWGIDKQINCFSPIGWNEDEIPYYDETTQTNLILEAIPGSTVYNERWDHFLTNFKKHLDLKGWFEKTVLYFDEISEEKAVPVIDKVIIPNNPAWKIGGTITYDFSAESKEKFHDLSGVLGRNFNTTRSDDKIFTFYTSCSQMFPNSFVTRENTTAEMTWMGWHASNKNYSGYLRWAYDNWQLDDPADARDGSNTAGDFSMVYRSSNTEPITCYPSLRLMMLREGIQDYEKIKTLKEIFKASDQTKLEDLNALIRKFTLSSGEKDVESLVEEGQEVIARLSHDLSSDLTSTEQIKPEPEKVKILLNPASEYIRIEFLAEQTMLQTRFFNLSGAEIKLPLIGNTDNVYSYSLKDISAGLYLVQIVTKEGVWTKKFLVR